MKKLVLALAIFASSAGAATYYVDRPQPFAVAAEAPCLVVVSPALVLNANLLTRVEYVMVGDKMLTEFASHNIVRRVEGNQVPVYLKAVSDCKALSLPQKG